MSTISDDPRLTAYVLDELDEDGRKFVQNEMRRVNECRFEARELADFTDRLRAALATEPMPELAPKQERAIAARLQQMGSRRRPFWIPIAANWLLRTELTLMAVLALWFVPIPGTLSRPVTEFFGKASLHATRVMLQAVGTRVEWHGSSLVLLGPPRIIPRGSSAPGSRVMIDLECNPLYWITILLAASLLAGNLYLRAPWRKLALTAVVIPLVVLSDALRKFLLVEWLVHHTNSRSIELPLSDLAQPVFVALSLVALIPILIWFRRSELKRERVGYDM